MIMEHIKAEELQDGFYKLTPEEGYKLYNQVTQRTYSEAITKTPRDFVAIPK